MAHGTFFAFLMGILTALFIQYETRSDFKMHSMTLVYFAISILYQIKFTYKETSIEFDL